MPIIFKSILAFIFLGSLLSCSSYAGTTGEAEQNWQQKAIELSTKAQQGDALAQYNLGCFYAGGKGVKQDFALALSWLEKAAKQGTIGCASPLSN